MRGSSIWQFASFLMLGPYLSCAADAAFDPQTVQTGATARPAVGAPEQAAGGDKPRNVDLHPKPPVPVSEGEITAAMERGVAFLLTDQNMDGSWGSPERTKDLNIIAGIGSHHSFRAAVTVALRLGSDRGQRPRQLA